MYLHCHNCNWSQDDFWDKSYNPIRSMLDWEEALLEKSEEAFPVESDTAGMSYGEVIAMALERAASTIKNMKWPTYNSWLDAKKAGTPVCPKCGSSQHFDMD